MSTLKRPDVDLYYEIAGRGSPVLVHRRCERMLAVASGWLLPPSDYSQTRTWGFPDLYLVKVFSL